MARWIKRSFGVTHEELVLVRGEKIAAVAIGRTMTFAWATPVLATFSASNSIARRRKPK